MSEMTLLELAERCEKATGADRELDARIADAIKWWPAGFSRKDVHGPDRRWCDDRRVSGRVPDRIDCPPYTASLDAAMTLVPEGLDWGINREQGQGVAWCGHFPWNPTTSAATPALALTAAALRARASMEQKA